MKHSGWGVFTEFQTCFIGKRCNQKVKLGDNKEEIALFDKEGFIQLIDPFPLRQYIKLICHYKRTLRVPIYGHN